MTISEKLTKIAENIPKVYDAGYQAAVDHYEEEFSITGKLATYDKGIKGYPYKVTSTIELPEIESGYTSMVVCRCGKNLFDYTKYTFVNNYIKHDTGTSHGSSTSSCILDFIPCSHLQGQTITLNHPPIEVEAGNPGMAFYTDTIVESYISSGGAQNGYTAIVPDNANYFRFSVPRAYADGTQIQIEIGDTVTDYEPYNEKIVSNSLSLSDAVYDGTYDWDTGVLSKHHGSILLRDLEWNVINPDGVFEATLQNAKTPDGSVQNDSFISGTRIYYWHHDANDADGCYDDIYQNALTEDRYYAIRDNSIVFSYREGEDFEAWLGEDDAVLVYPLAEPEKLYLNPCQVAAIEGNNYLYCIAAIEGATYLYRYIGNTTVSNRKNIEADMCEIFNAAIMRQSGE